VRSPSFIKLYSNNSWKNEYNKINDHN